MASSARQPQQDATNSADASDGPVMLDPVAAGAGASKALVVALRKVHADADLIAAAARPGSSLRARSAH